jgi:hypothetical protein
MWDLQIDRFGVHVDLAGKETDGLGEATDRIIVEPFHNSSLSGISPPNQQPVATLKHSLESHGENALHRAGLTGECEFADDREVPRPVEGHLTTAQQQPHHDRKVEAVGIFLQVCRSALAKRSLNT